MTAPIHTFETPRTRRPSLRVILQRWLARRRAAHRAAALRANPHLARDIGLSEHGQAPLPPLRHRD
ncbi:hypothetical protein [Salipiger sp. PrR002]|uniref:hypothetical protein n=1 Tax=Salipiger sp. PrR002 TaxID=2706489 RepID=UPI0013BA40B3|nr:hypothetical protein [Salipiger sp. PrR002]NDW00608.1 hypothetical protein [Salipiger sp. PrR002]NDW57563.1 hypothetical protein [Salipiger sp. PrR004]